MLEVKALPLAYCTVMMQEDAPPLPEKNEIPNSPMVSINHEERMVWINHEESSIMGATKHGYSASSPFFEDADRLVFVSTVLK